MFFEYIKLCFLREKLTVHFLRNSRMHPLNMNSIAEAVMSFAYTQWIVEQHIRRHVKFPSSTSYGHEEDIIIHKSKEAIYRVENDVAIHITVKDCFEAKLCLCIYQEDDCLIMKIHRKMKCKHGNYIRLVILKDKKHVQ